MSEADAYVDEWLAHEPEMELALLFCPRAGRRAAALWATLQRAFDHAVFELSDPSVAQAKLAWWRDELLRGAAGEGRHPLAREWFATPQAAGVPREVWLRIADRALALALDDRSPLDVDDALGRYAPYAQALADAESAAFAAATQGSALALERLLRRAAAPGQVREWPLQLLARQQLPREASAEPGAAARLRSALAGELLERWPSATGAPVLRRARLALDLRRLRHWHAGRADVSPNRLALPFMLWRAARSP